MADFYNRNDTQILNADTDILQVTSGVDEAWLLYINVYNITPGTDCTFKVWITDSTDTLIMQLTAEYSPLPAGAAELIIDRPIGMNPDDKIRAYASNNSICKCSAFILETTT